jgi:hypothetical protein
MKSSKATRLGKREEKYFQEIHAYYFLFLLVAHIRKARKP